LASKVLFRASKKKRGSRGNTLAEKKKIPYNGLKGKILGCKVKSLSPKKGHRKKGGGGQKDPWENNDWKIGENDTNVKKNPGTTQDYKQNVD